MTQSQTANFNGAIGEHAVGRSPMELGHILSATFMYDTDDSNNLTLTFSSFFK